LLPLNVGVVPGRPKARVRLPTSADTAQAPKNMIRAMTKANTSEKASGTGMRLVLINLVSGSLERFPQMMIR
jgi:hypothetical protein